MVKGRRFVPERSAVRLALAVCLAWLVACAAPPAPPAAPSAPAGSLPAAFATALASESMEGGDAAAYLDVIDQAVDNPRDGWSLAALVASLDALVGRQVQGLGQHVEHAVAHRSRDGMVEAAARLRAAWDRLGPRGGPMRGMLAEALHQLALRVGDERAAARWRTRAGCLGEATVIGPLDTPPLFALEQPSPIAAGSPILASYPGVPPFTHDVSPLVVAADACAIDVNATSRQPGLRVVVADLVVKRSGPIVVALTSSSAARVDLGGHRLLTRRYDEGPQPVTQMAIAHASAGRLRLVARIAQNQDGDTIRLAAWGTDGRPLAAVAPRPGDIAGAHVVEVQPLPVVPDGADASALELATAARLAVGHVRSAAAALRRAATTAGPSPGALDLLRIRAVQATHDLPPAARLRSVRGLAERILADCPRCWEARIALAEATREQGGFGTGSFAALAAAGVRPGAAGDDRGAVELAYVALVAQGAGLLDVARSAHARLAEVAPGSALLADVDAWVHPRSGPDRVQAACAGGTSRASTACLRAHGARGDHAAVREEIERLRRLRGNADLHRSIEIQQRMLEGKLDEALRLYDALPPPQRDLATLAVAFSGDTAAGPLRARLARDMLDARDAPGAYEPLARLLGLVDAAVVAKLEDEGRALVARDRAEAFLPGAGTAVLRHIEHYELARSGLLRSLSYDLRRVSGTSDVALGAFSGDALVSGRAAQSTLRRRIYKSDGRVLDPDPSATGSQGHTELSQLQAGDYVEVITVGWALPSATGQLVVDTPDLLPDRTSVREARIELKRPAALPLSVWAHAELGEGVSRTLGSGLDAELHTVWELHDRAPRRFESGVPFMEARVALSFGTDGWQRISRALAHRYRGLDDQDPYMTTWVAGAVPDRGAPKEAQVAALVAAVGRAVRQADAYALSDEIADLGGGAQVETARSFLERGNGSRTWVIHRALRELGLQSRIAVSETRPFSAAPTFPAHTGRFTHPLVQVDLEGGSLWIDADVEGPPLPPGRISPELRGRQALLADGRIVTVEGESGRDADEVDIRLVVDDRGDASGTFKAVLRGKPAQRISSALEVLVGAMRTDELRRVVLGWLPWADVRDVTLTSDAGSWQVELTAQIHIAGFAQPVARGGAARVSLPGMPPVHDVSEHVGATTLADRYTAQAERTAALGIAQPMLYRVTRTITLPSGARVLGAPAPLHIATPHIEAERRVEVDRAVVRERFELNLPVGTVPLEGYDAFAQSVGAIDQGFLHGIDVVLEPPTPTPR